MRRRREKHTYCMSGTQLSYIERHSDANLATSAFFWKMINWINNSELVLFCLGDTRSQQLLHLIEASHHSYQVDSLPHATIPNAFPYKHILLRGFGTDVGWDGNSELVPLRHFLIFFKQPLAIHTSQTVNTRSVNEVKQCCSTSALLPEEP